jgi:threonine/homoserine/homoserine lactone efflux protein
MDLTGLMVFAAALAVAAASPGPTVTALVARVLVRGTSGALAFMLGLSIGELVWLTSAVLGLAFIAKTFAIAFLGLKYAGAAYLAYLAWRMWTAPAQAKDAPPPEAEHPAKLFFAAVSLTLGNPKIMVFYLALLPNLIDLQAVDALGYVELVATTFVVLTLVDGAYVLLAARARKLLSSPRAIKLVNRGSGALLAGAAVAIATRS